MHLGAHAPRADDLQDVFPHVLDVDSGVILIGSRYPIQIDVPAWEARLRSPRPISASCARERSQTA